MVDGHSPEPRGRPKGCSGGDQGRLHGSFTLFGESRLVEARLSGLDPYDRRLALRSRQRHLARGMLDDPVGAIRMIAVCHHHDSVDTIENRPDQRLTIPVVRRIVEPKRNGRHEWQ